MPKCSKIQTFCYAINVCVPIFEVFFPLSIRYHTYDVIAERRLCYSSLQWFGSSGLTEMHGNTFHLYSSLEEKICVTGRFPCKYGREAETKFVNVKFGHTFLRKPAVSYAISAFQGITGSRGDYFCLFSREVKNITPSTADMKIEKCEGAITHCYYSWIACL